MIMGNSLRFKLILYTFCSILLSFIVAGVTIDYFLAGLFGTNAKDEARHAYNLVYDRVKRLEKDMISQSALIAMDPGVIASINLIGRYQDISNYQPLIFDEEKRNLADLFFRRTNLFHNATTAAYSSAGELIAFSMHSNINNSTGIVTYENGQPIYLRKEMIADTWNPQPLPPQVAPNIQVDNSWDSFISSVGSIDFVSTDNELTIESIRTIKRTDSKGKSRSFGFIKITVALDLEFVKEVTERAHTTTSLLLANGKIVNNPNKINSLKDLDKHSILFGSTIAGEQSWLTHKTQFIQSYVLPAVNGKVYLLLSQPKSELSQALNSSRLTLALIFLFTALLIITFAIYWLNSRISKPLNTLTRQLGAIENNKYPLFYETNLEDEVDLLGKGLNRMVGLIKSRETDLKSSQHDLSEAQHIAKIGNWKIDILNKKLYWSDEVYNIFGLDSETFIPTYDTFLKAVFIDDQEKVDVAYIDSLKNNSPYEIDYRIQMNKGSIKHVRQHFETQFDDNGTAIYSRGTIQDVTEQKQKDELINRTQKMDALGKLTGGIAHDFNNMLGVILGFSEILQRLLEDDPKKLKYINNIITAGDRASILTKKLLSFSKKEANSTEIININDSLIDDRNMLEKTVTARINLQYKLEQDLWSVLIDKSDFQNAILNMSINAMHAMQTIQTTGNLTIQTLNTHMNALDVQHLNINSGDYVLLSMTDTGIGMDEETRNSLFDPFFSTKGHKGTGLGMTQVYSFVQQSRGAIKIYSEPGYGTKLAIYLPRCSDDDSDLIKKKYATDTPIEMGHETILVVDDEVFLRELVKEILSGHNYQVLCAESGADALNILKTHSVDLLLSDVIMPGMDGYQLAEQVHELYPDILIQMVSGFSDDRHLSSHNELLHKKRLQKPFTSSSLLRRIRQLCDDHRDSDELYKMTSVTDSSLIPIEWSSKYISGIKALDHDHKKLLELINHCTLAVQQDKSYAEILSILEELLSYLDLHFKREELIMKVCEYPKEQEHQREHEYFRAQVEDYVKKYGKGTLTAKALLELLVDWLNSHIIGKDLDIVPYCEFKDKEIEQALNSTDFEH